MSISFVNILCFCALFSKMHTKYVVVLVTLSSRRPTKKPPFPFCFQWWDGGLISFVRRAPKS